MGGAYGCWRGQFGYTTDADCLCHNKHNMRAHFICSPGVWMPHNEPCMNILGSWHKKFANWLPPLHCLSVINLTRGRWVETDPGTLTRHNPRAKISPRAEPELGQFRPLANCIYTWSKYRSRLDRQIRYPSGNIFILLNCFGLNVYIQLNISM